VKIRAIRGKKQPKMSFDFTQPDKGTKLKFKKIREFVAEQQKTSRNLHFK
jgi:hypothetical protein